MECSASRWPSGQDRETAWDREFRWAGPEVRSRQAAAVCLVAATATENPIERTLLRRRAADLILTRSGQGNSGR